MKKLLAIALCGAMVMSMAACGAKDDAAPAEAAPAAAETSAVAEADDTSAPAEVASTDGTFTVGFDAEFPPYGYMGDDGEYTGFDLDLAAEVCARNGWELVKQPIDWDAKDMELNSGSIDCIWNGFTMNGREEEYEWSTPYVDNSIVCVVKADAEINTLADLAGLVVETQKDSSALAALESDPDLVATFAAGEAQQVSDYNTAFQDLDAGVCDCIVVDIGVARYQLASRGDGYKIVEEDVASEQYAVGFKLGNTELRDTVQATLEEMYKDGTFDEIAQKYADDDIPDCVCLGNYVQ